MTGFCVAGTWAAGVVALHQARGALAALAYGVVYRDAASFDQAGQTDIAVLCARTTLLMGSPEIVALEALGDPRRGARPRPRGGREHGVAPRVERGHPRGGPRAERGAGEHQARDVPLRLSASRRSRPAATAWWSGAGPSCSARR